MALNVYYLGLNDEDHHGNRLVERQVPWVVPARLCHELQNDVSMGADDEEEERPREVSMNLYHAVFSTFHAFSLIKFLLR